MRKALQLAQRRWQQEDYNEYWADVAEFLIYGLVRNHGEEAIKHVRPIVYSDTTTQPYYASGESRWLTNYEFLALNLVIY